ncbi:MAG: caspase family protein, partial [Isosphaeraceae bacterium]|nr:caspase family protein [Isosphaeraceae bacterium]
PRLVIDPPPQPLSSVREAKLTISLGESGLEDLRLYQNGTPVAVDLEAGRRRVEVPVRLRKGTNRFYAMATRPGSRAFDGRSNVVEVRYEGDEAAGRVHGLALGVSRYRQEKRSLKFAASDAAELADFLRTHGVNAAREPGVWRVLADEEITEEAVDGAFREIRDQTAGRPEDTVVVFLAGHVDVLGGRFSLLLSRFRFPEKPGERLGPFDIDPDTVLTFAAIYRNLARLSALQRLVIVDACQSEAIFDDAAVGRIRESLDSGAYRSRTAYFLAARRGEPAYESPALEHGLLTYVLLKGMGHRRLKPVDEVTIFQALPTADRNGDGLVTTDELRWFTDATLPPLAAKLPTLLQRSGAGGRPLPERPNEAIGQAPRLQGMEVSFPLVEVPRDASEVEAGP